VDLIFSISEDFVLSIRTNILRIGSIRIILSRKISFSRFEFFIRLFFSRTVPRFSFFRPAFLFRKLSWDYLAQEEATCCPNEIEVHPAGSANTT